MQTKLFLTHKDHERPLSLDDFEHADAEEGYQYELIGGRLQVSPLPDLPHEELRDWLKEALNDYAKQHPDVINHVKAPARIFVSGRSKVTAPEPDVAAYRDFPLDLPLSQRRWRDFHPVLVIEVLSEDNAEKDLERNRKLYLDVPSIREYWIVDPITNPDQPSLLVYRRRGSRWQRPIQVGAGGKYSTPLLPGFSLVLNPLA
jgi:Uma2 family endonuclease